MRNKGMKNRHRPDNRGISFVEVIVSMMILSIAVLALLGGFMLSLRINMKSRRAMSATIVAQNVMECVKEYARFRRMKPEELLEVLDQLGESAAGFKTMEEWFGHMEEYKRRLKEQAQVQKAPTQGISLIRQRRLLRSETRVSAP